MRNRYDDEFLERELLLAGSTAPAGIYKNLKSGRIVSLTEEGILPGSLDGEVACYLPVPQERVDFLTSQNNENKISNEN